MLTPTYYCTIDDGTHTIVHRPSGQVFCLYVLDNIGNNATTDLVGIFKVESRDEFFTIDKMVNWFAGATCYDDDELFTNAMYYLNAYFQEETK